MIGVNGRQADLAWEDTMAMLLDHSVIKKKKTSFPEEILREIVPANWQDRDVSYKPEDRSMKLIRARDITNRFPQHVHEKLYIGIIEKGMRQMKYRGSSSYMRPGQIFLINIGEPHECDDDDLSLKIVGFSENAFLQIAREISPDVRFDAISFSKLVVTDRFLFSEIASFLSLLDTDAAKLAVESKINGILSRIIMRHTSCSAALSGKPLSFTASVRLAKEYIRENYACDISLNDLARLTGLTSYHLSRIFTATYGVPPHQYLTHIRVATAKQALLNSDAALADIALGSGFYDHSHFCRTFKRFTGNTPREFVKQNKPKIIPITAVEKKKRHAIE
jgi:AraC-like DNA-binding protein